MFISRDNYLIRLYSIYIIGYNYMCHLNYILYIQMALMT